MHSNHTQDTATITTYSVDPAHSQVGFVVRHMGFSKVRGRFSEFEGTIEMESGSLESLRAEANIEAASIDTRSDQRDEHLRSADFFDSENHPRLTFTTREVRASGDDRFTILGDLTIRGTTRPVELKAEFLGEGVDPWGGSRIALEARTKINRKDFGLTWNQMLEAGGVLVSEEVEIVLEIQATAQQDED